jgi:ParB-like chromosome segregation protein Spo0J
MATDAELDELAADIEKHGIRSPIAVWRPTAGAMQGVVLDGRNRLAAAERLGWTPSPGMVGGNHLIAFGNDHPSAPVLDLHGGKSKRAVDPYEYVLSANLHRRHLTVAQRREIVAKVLQAQPEKSDRQVAKSVGTSPTTVGSERKKLEQAGDVSKLDTRTDTKGREQPATKPKKPKRAPAVPETPPAPPADAQTSGSRFASWVAAKADGVEQTARELAQATPADVNDEADAALDRLGEAGKHLYDAVCELAVRTVKEKNR